jgi:hypothetical protein
MQIFIAHGRRLRRFFEVLNGPEYAIRENECGPPCAKRFPGETTFASGAAGAAARGPLGAPPGAHARPPAALRGLAVSERAPGAQAGTRKKYFGSKPARLAQLDTHWTAARGANTKSDLAFEVTPLSAKVDFSRAGTPPRWPQILKSAAPAPN